MADWHHFFSESRPLSTKSPREEALLMNSLTNSGLKPFCTEISFKNGAWKEYFRLYRRTFEYTVRVAGPDLAYFFAMK